MIIDLKKLGIYFYLLGGCMLYLNMIHTTNIKIREGYFIYFAIMISCFLLSKIIYNK